MAEIDADQTFEGTASGAAKVYPQQASALRKGGHVMLKGHPCKIVEMSSSKTGKHGHAKIHFIGLDIFTGKKYEDLCPSTHNMEVPNVTRVDLSLTNITDDGFLELMTDDGQTREDIKLPEDAIGEEIRKRFDDGESILVSILKSMDQEAAIAVKNDNVK